MEIEIFAIDGIFVVTNPGPIKLFDSYEAITMVHSWNILRRKYV